MPRRRRPPTPPKQPQAIVEKRRGSVNSVNGHTAGREFDRKRYAVELTADFRDDSGILVAQREVLGTCGNALDEKLHCREFQGLGGREVGILGWIIQREQ